MIARARGIRGTNPLKKKLTKRKEKPKPPTSSKSYPPRSETTAKKARKKYGLMEVMICRNADNGNLEIVTVCNLRETVYGEKMY